MSVGSIGSSAFTQYAYSSVKPQGRGDMEAKFAEMDTDGNGSLSLEESGLSEEIFTKMDANGDGQLDENDRDAHMAQGPPPPPPPPGSGDQTDVSSLIESLDTNGDGVISEEESGLESELFGQIDSDGDGLLTQVEMENHAAAMLGDTESVDLQAASESLMSNYGLGAYQAQSDMSLLNTLFGQDNDSLSVTA